LILCIDLRSRMTGFASDYRATMIDLGLLDPITGLQ
jgi:hypothetical protein